MQRTVGIRDVANEAGVSVTTVSHALNGKGRVGAETRVRIQEIAERLGYHPNAVARSLAGGRTGLIGLAVARTLESEFAVSDFAYYAQLMSAATSVAFDTDCALVLASGVPGRPWMGMRLDGLIVVDPVHDDPLCKEFREREIPLVTTARIPGEPRESGYWVDTDHDVSTYAILDHLAERGAERIALIASPPVTSYSLDVRSAYDRWCGEHGQERVVALARSDLTESAGFEAMTKLLRRSRPPDAIYATLDRLALGVLLAAEAQGMSVPRDLLVAGCTDSEASKLARPSLTALSLHPDEIGREAVKMMMELIEGREPPERHVFVPSEVVPRQSTRRRVVSRPGKRQASTRA